MNTSTKICMVLLVMSIAFVAGSAYASVSVTSVALGGTNQDRGVNTSVQFTITNGFNESINVTSLTSTADVSFKVQFSGVTLPVAIPAGGTVQPTATVFVPKNFDGINTKGENIAPSIGTLVAGFSRANGTTGTATSGMTLQAENRLTIRKTEIDIVGEKLESHSVDDGDDFDVRPGDKVTLEVKVENEFTDNEDVEIRKIRAKLDLEESNAFDIDDDVDTFDLEADEEEIVRFTFDVEEDAERGSHDVEILVTGRDENGALHGDRLTFSLRVKRETHDLKITGLEVSPTKIVCSDRATTVEVQVQAVNRGTRDEEAAVIELTAPDFSFKEKTGRLLIDVDERETAQFVLPIPKNAAAGTHRIRATAFIEDTIQLSSKDVLLTVEACSQTTTNGTATQTNTTATGATVTTGPTIISQPPLTGGIATATPTTQARFTDSPIYLVLLGGLIVLGFVAVVGVAAYFFMRK